MGISMVRNGMDQHGAEWNGSAWCGMEWISMGRNGMDQHVRNGMDQHGAEWNGSAQMDQNVRNGSECAEWIRMCGKSFEDYQGKHEATMNAAMANDKVIVNLLAECDWLLKSFHLRKEHVQCGMDFDEK